MGIRIWPQNTYYEASMSILLQYGLTIPSIDGAVAHGDVGCWEYAGIRVFALGGFLNLAEGL